MKFRKNNLAKAYEELEKLNIETTLEQFKKLSILMSELANKQFESGLNAGEEIFKTKIKQPR